MFYSDLTGWHADPYPVVSYSDPYREMLRVAGGGVPKTGFPYDPIWDLVENHGFAAISAIVPVPAFLRNGIPTTVALRLQVSRAGGSLAVDVGPGGGGAIAAGVGLMFGNSPSRSALTLTAVGGEDVGGGVYFANYGGRNNQELGAFVGAGYGAGINVGVTNVLTSSLWSC